MSPIFDKSSDLSEYDNRVKIVREGRTVAYYITNTDHSAIARLYDLGTPIKEGWYEREVDDAGSLFDCGELGLQLRGWSSTCKVRGDPQQQRDKTAEIIQEITGRNVERF